MAQDKDMDAKKKYAILLPVIVMAMVCLFVFGKKAPSGVYQHESGMVFGTVYNISYEASESYKTAIDSALAAVDRSLSPFNEKSVITAVNQNQPVELDDMFISVFELARHVSQDTQGAFDITAAPLVNAWGFGFKSGAMPNATQLDSLRQLVGYEKVRLADGRLVKDDPRVMLDCSAIAKGYGVDVVADVLRSHGVENLMVEIGGEIVCRGNNSQGKTWSIGVSKPTDDSLAVNNELQTILSFTDKAMATSGNYRNFYYKDGRKYAHTIDPHSGKPVQHSLLSATVIAPTCAEADAYATSFMVMGIEKARQVLKRHNDLEAYFIYTNDKGELAVWFTPAMKKYIKE